MKNKLPVTLIFDIGKTNKKALLFDEQYDLVHETSQQLDETKDEDGFPCEDVELLTKWIQDSLATLQNDKRFAITAINASAYGASFVHLNHKHKPFLPLYNYLKPCDENLQKQFYNHYGGEEKMAEETASPVLGNLNSGMQLYGLKYAKPDVYSNVACSLHLPQYISFLLSGALYSDITSIGCHTHLWNFKQHNYHYWVYNETIDQKLAPLISCTEIAGMTYGKIPTGCGLHDSSAALIPYLASLNEPFILLSTGTWNISINPFNHQPLTNDELKQDCLSYLSYEGKAIKASRLFAGHEHEQQVKRIAAHFNTSSDYCKTILFDASIYYKLQRMQPEVETANHSATIKQSPFSNRNLHHFETYEEAYHQLMCDIMEQQVAVTKLVMDKEPVQKLFVDGGFSKNDIYMNSLAIAFPHIEVYAATVAQASALGAAIAIRQAVGDHKTSAGFITAKHYQPARGVVR